ncbi:DUF4280 domain-containing protein [Marinibactrum halimedae]|uniref:DUF4280 domain-containing protein n=1 Tax=Marinibactrum halimedae TaxID=1444977 RepID=A0AA37T766_9GAMM|nr:DUF4280 domain-containing protein [Marinibactrum halimedae]MCD9458097.1 DUF4280 domain-containing protein [Marinibactrum halimedae]GLS25031.1 hypothetical protein GCM10007877_07450 [Marinibactrum halimedae]
MPQCVCAGATLKCTFGAAPSALIVTPENRVLEGAPGANIKDHIPLKNILPFGPCSSLAFPPTASATAAALGALTPMPCIPSTPAPWVPGDPTVLLANMPILTKNSLLTCMWGGIITIQQPGQMKVEAVL